MNTLWMDDPKSYNFLKEAERREVAQRKSIVRYHVLNRKTRLPLRVRWSSLQVTYMWMCMLPVVTGGEVCGTLMDVYLENIISLMIYESTQFTTRARIEFQVPTKFVRIPYLEVRPILILSSATPVQSCCSSRVQPGNRAKAQNMLLTLSAKTLSLFSSHGLRPSKCIYFPVTKSQHS